MMGDGCVQSLSRAGTTSRSCSATHHVSAVLPKGRDLLIFVNTFLLKSQEQLMIKCLRVLTVFLFSILTGIFRRIINCLCLLF